ncbi:MAG: hypothetical protein ACP5QP_01170 [Brevinematia bacterium]
MSKIQILDKTELLPDYLKSKYREINGFAYKESKLFIVKVNDKDVGAVRVAIRDDKVHKEGLISDLSFSDHEILSKVGSDVIKFAESYLLSLGINKIEAIVEEGKKLNYIFYDNGYWPSWKPVVISWDLENLNLDTPKDIDFNSYQFDIIHSKDFTEDFIEEISKFVFDSYQPYFRWWREYKNDYRWWRTNYDDGSLPQLEDYLKEEMIGRIRDYLLEIKNKNSIIVRGFIDGKLEGICDAIVDEKEENMVIGVAVSKKLKAKNFGSILLINALKFLKDNGVKQPIVITTSGLDDYDPTVYLYTLAGKGQIVKEYTVLIKRKFSDSSTNEIIDIGQPLSL